MTCGATDHLPVDPAHWERDWTVPPGETLLEALQERGMSQSYLAFATGYSPKHINQIVKGHVRISVEVALAFERELDISARFWLHRQADYDIDIARGLKS